MGLEARIPVFGGLQTIKAQTSLSLPIQALLFTFGKVSYLDIPQAKFQISS